MDNVVKLYMSVFDAAHIVLFWSLACSVRFMVGLICKFVLMQMTAPCHVMHVISASHFCGACRRNWDSGRNPAGKGDGPILKVFKFHCPTCEAKYSWGEVPLCLECTRTHLLHKGMCTKGHKLRTSRTKPGACYKAAGGIELSA